jgi:hypothetical protein
MVEGSGRKLKRKSAEKTILCAESFPKLIKIDLAQIPYGKTIAILSIAIIAFTPDSLLLISNSSSNAFFSLLSGIPACG